MPRKIHFQVVASSSADEQHPASELNRHGPLVTGWRSNQFCSYPQELILQFENYARIRRLQILSHQYLIGKRRSSSAHRYRIFACLASKIEFFIGDCTSDESLSLENARFTRLG